MEWFVSVKMERAADSVTIFTSDTGLVPKMIVLWLSESVPNCLLSSAHEGKLIQFTVTKDIPQLAGYLKTRYLPL